MYLAKIYYAGPQTVWSRRVDEREVIATIPAPFLWMVRWCVRSVYRSLDARRCGYLIIRDTELLEHVEAMSPETHSI